MKPKAQIILLILMILAISCQKPSNEPVTNVDSMTDLKASENFSFDPSQEVTITVTALNTSDEPLDRVRIELYSGDKDDETATKITTGITDANGQLVSTFKNRSYRDSIFVKTRYIGLPSSFAFHLDQNIMQIQIGGAEPEEVANSSSIFYKSIYADGIFDYLGKYTTGSNKGKPGYLDKPDDKLDKDFLADINKALPEEAPVPTAHPEYLAASNQTNTVLSKKADVWVTFVHEGAGFRNSLCFYDYNTNTPPASADQIDKLSVIFPNLSYSKDGQLKTGNKVHIGQFEAGTEIAWALVADGWNGKDVSENKARYYSDLEFNPESTTANKQHNVLLYDKERELFLIGFEDLNRDGYTDNDFNDAIFYVTTNPVDAAVTEDIPELYPEEIDTDNDGVIESSDDYPEDSDKAFDNFFPAENEFGSLAFEDLWPAKGDYDFNDLVVDYNINQIANSSNKFTSINATFKVRAVGAGYKNGFGIQLPIKSNLVESVTGTNVPGNIVTLSGNGTEAGQDKATIIIFENVYDLFPGVTHGYINTKEDDNFTEYQTIEVAITFTKALSIDELGLPPYNPFLIVNQERGKEVHLPNYAPTDLADELYFGTGEDDSDASKGRYYRDNDNLPWAMHIPTAFEYPIENNSIIQGHLVFDNWVLSDGFSYMDWYLDKPQYRNATKLYKNKNK